MILSDTINIKNKTLVTSEYIEKFLFKKYGNILRWAIVDISDNALKVSFSYEK